MTNNYCAVMIFNRKFNQEKNRFEIAEDFFDEFENCDVLGAFHMFPKEIGKDTEEDIFLVDIKFENINLLTCIIFMPEGLQMLVITAKELLSFMCLMCQMLHNWLIRKMLKNLLLSKRRWLLPSITWFLIMEK